LDRSTPIQRDRTSTPARIEQPGSEKCWSPRRPIG
jgi:hypothetical protein